MDFSTDPSNVSLAGGGTQRQRFGLGPLLIVLLAGIGFTGVSSFIYFSTRIDPSWTKVSGQVIDTQATGGRGAGLAPVVQYQVNGQEYKVTSNESSSSSPAIGSTSQVAYNPSNPQEAKVVVGTGSTLFILGFVALGILMLVIAPVLFAQSLRRSRDIKALMQTGKKLQGVITDIQRTSGSGSATYTYKIIVSASDATGTVQNYTSDGLTGVGSLTMADFHSQPIPIDVYISLINPKDYYVDISKIPSLTPERIAELIESSSR